MELGEHRDVLRSVQQQERKPVTQGARLEAEEKPKVLRGAVWLGVGVGVGAHSVARRFIMIVLVQMTIMAITMMIIIVTLIIMAALVMMVVITPMIMMIIIMVVVQ